MPKMQKKKKIQHKKQTGKKINRERAREYQVHFFSFFLYSVPTFWWQKPAEK